MNSNLIILIKIFPLNLNNCQLNIFKDKILGIILIMTIIIVPEVTHVAVEYVELDKIINFKHSLSSYHFLLKPIV